MKKAIISTREVSDVKKKSKLKQKCAYIFYSTIFGIEQHQQPTCGVYLQALLHILGTMYLVPFRIKLKQAESYTQECPYELESRGFIAKLLCMVIQVGGVITGFWNAYEVTNVKGMAATILSVFSFLSEFCISILTWNLLWHHRNLVLDVLNAFAKYSIPNSNCQSSNWKLKVCAVVAVILCIAFVQGYVSVFQASVIDKIASGMVTGLKTILKWIKPNIKLETLTLSLVIYKVLSVWLYFSLRLTFLFEMKLIVMLVYVFNLACDNFLAIANETKSIDKVKSIKK